MQEKLRRDSKLSHKASFNQLSLTTDQLSPPLLLWTAILKSLRHSLPVPACLSREACHSLALLRKRLLEILSLLHRRTNLPLAPLTFRRRQQALVPVTLVSQRLYPARRRCRRLQNLLVTHWTRQRPAQPRLNPQPLKVEKPPHLST